MPLVFDPASELRRTQLEDARLVVEPGSNDLFQDEAFDIRERNVANGHLENHPVLVRPDKGFLQEPPVGGGFESQQMLGNPALKKFHVRVLKFGRSKESLALLYSVENFLKGRRIRIVVVAIVAVVIAAATAIDRCRSVASGGKG